MTFRRSRTIALGVFFCLASAAGCGGDDTPTTPSPVLATDVFTGTISPLGSASHTFNVNYAYAYSEASVTVTSLATVAGAAPQAITIGVGFGQTSVGVCTRVANLTNPAASLNVELPTGSVFGPGTYCVQVFDNPDAPTVTEPLAYSITVRHY